MNIEKEVEQLCIKLKKNGKSDLANTIMRAVQHELRFCGNFPFAKPVIRDNEAVQILRILRLFKISQIYHVGDSRIKSARSTHKCTKCGRVIKKKEGYRKMEVSRGSGYPVTVKLCRECETMAFNKLPKRSKEHAKLPHQSKFNFIFK